jgi:hypothetical protein
MRTFVITIFLLATQTCIAQLKVANLDKNSIPNDIQYKGNIIQAVRWMYSAKSWHSEEGKKSFIHSSE